MRTFIALELPDATRDALSRLQDRLRAGRQIDEDDLHVTLSFLGEVDLPRLTDLDLDLQALRVPHPAVEIAGLATFGTDPPRSVHAAVRATPELVHLQAKVAAVVRRAGIALPHRRFVPHVTLARFSRSAPPEELARLGRFLSAHGDFRLDPVMVPEITLFRSRLDADGAIYEVLERYPI
ncbi:RNA 2',3'-cyclic phosphodiesterase [Palleronia sediminis]|uniref:RNA 2',3'-cyclic phosphodiesterase n=1 Tax=Palleronia sediminis TaxID=2547833 RepID=A0A4V3BA12_9RHOB|nr:RNA 2',3'-cyclic phosphodiesterase [Palleronia sediminis]TDL81319.1 RNA 2',3'-cyclic phosphodiesterase [Palleronia sediminis]